MAIAVIVAGIFLVASAIVRSSFGACQFAFVPSVYVFSASIWQTGDAAMALSEDEPKKPADYVVGQDVSLLSAGELQERIEILRAEIERLEAERGARGATKSAAEALFRRS
jgi:uncharacterized small protein (DUF1192 family)